MVKGITSLKLIMRSFQIKPNCVTASLYSKLSHDYVHDAPTTEEVHSSWWKQYHKLKSWHSMCRIHPSRAHVNNDVDIQMLENTLYRPDPNTCDFHVLAILRKYQNCADLGWTKTLKMGSSSNQASLVLVHQLRHVSQDSWKLLLTSS
jgi:hypothetical protein